MGSGRRAHQAVRKLLLSQLEAYRHAEHGCAGMQPVLQQLLQVASATNSCDYGSTNSWAATSASAAAWHGQVVRGYRATIQNQGKATKGKAAKAEKAAAGVQSPVDAPAPEGAQAGAVSAQQDFTSMLQVPHPSPMLTSEQIGNYYALQPRLIPEAFASLYAAFYAPRGDTERPRPGGCAGLQREAHAVSLRVPTSTPLLMHRQITHQLWTALSGDAAAESNTPQRWLLRGPAGSGKSCVVAALVERARASGWLCVYLPSATTLIKGGFFVKRGEGEAAQWDTPIAAQHLLLGLQQAHGDKLKTLPCRLDSSRSLLGAQQAASGGLTQGSATVGRGTAGSTSGGSTSGPTLDALITHGLAAEDAHTPVDVALAVLQELAALPAGGSNPAVLVAVDDYNALYGETGYGQHVREQDERGTTRVTRVPLTPAQLRLASALRLLEQGHDGLGRVHVVAATSDSISVSPKVTVPLGTPGSEATEVFVPRYTHVEAAHALQHYYDCGLAPHPPTTASVARMMLVTNGNAAEVRDLARSVALMNVGLARGLAELV